MRWQLLALPEAGCEAPRNLGDPCVAVTVGVVSNKLRRERAVKLALAVALRAAQGARGVQEEENEVPSARLMQDIELQKQTSQSLEAEVRRMREKLVGKKTSRLQAVCLGQDRRAAGPLRTAEPVLVVERASCPMSRSEVR